MKIYKKLTYILLLGYMGTCFAQLQIPGEATIYNENQKQYLDDSNISNPIRDGAYAAIESPNEDNKIGGIQ
ncbi:TPA: hypothetical protein DEP21_02760 [Patescibacteria group bacterium]|nr:hypothetical protein [Candidatus Gracilibacteria bacterium]